MKNLRLLRKEQGLSLKQLGEIIGVAESTISLYETGKRQPDQTTLLKIADYFDVSTDYLLDRTNLYLNNDVSIFSMRLKELRKDAKMTREELAKLLNIGTSSISRYEFANVIPNVKILKKISNIFNVSVDYLLGQTDIPNIPEELKGTKVAFYDGAFDGLEKQDMDMLIEMAKRLKEKN